MLNLIDKILIEQQYRKIPSNVPFVTLYAKYVNSDAVVVQLIDCEKDIRLTVQQFDVFCDKAKSFIRDKGYENVELLSIVVTSGVGEARKFVIGDNGCWLLDTINLRLIIFDNQPNDFHGLKTFVEDELLLNRASMQNRLSNDLSVDVYKQERTPVRVESASRNFTDEFTLVNSIVVVINILVFFIMSSMGSTEDVEFMLSHGSMYAPAIIDNHEYYRFVTCMFQHFGFMHLMGNMVVLLFLGDNVERAVGKIKYIVIYILGGIIGSIGSFTYATVYNREIVSAGASGAIFALIGALLWLVIRNKGKLENMTTLRVCVLIAYALYNGFISDNVDMAAHLFGLAGGFLLAFILYRKPQMERNY